MPPPPLIDLDGVDLTRDLLTREQIYADQLPQRHEFMVLDAVCHLDCDAKTLVAYADIASDAWWSRGHLPGRPLLPGVIMLEMAAQASALAAVAFGSTTGFVAFGGVDGCKFRATVVPPCRLYLLVLAKQLRPRRIASKTQGIVDGELVFEADITGLVLR